MDDKRKKFQEKLKELEQVESVLRDFETAVVHGGDVAGPTDILMNAIDRIQEELSSMELEFDLAKLDQGQLENGEAVRVLGKYILKLIEDILDKSIDQ